VKWPEIRVTTDEIRAALSFACEHEARCETTLFRLITASGGGIGTGLFIQCQACKTKQDITDYSAW
jgi:hypothetical protein